MDDRHSNGARLRIGFAPRLLVAASAGAAALAIVVLILAVSHKPVNSGPASSIVGGEALVEFPYETASDVVSYADQVSRVTAISEKRAPDDVAPGEGDGSLITREVTFRIEETFWHREGAPSLDGTFVASRGGWVSQSFDDGPKVEAKLVLEGAPWIDVGSQYIMPLAFNKDEWEPIMPLAEFAFDSDLGVSPEASQMTPLANELSGATLDEVTVVFTAATPDPAAAQHFDLQPSARQRAVIAERSD